MQPVLGRGRGTMALGFSPTGGVQGEPVEMRGQEDKGQTARYIRK